MSKTLHQFTLKYIISMISTLFKSMCTPFSQRQLLVYTVQLLYFMFCNMFFLFHWAWHCLQFNNPSLYFLMTSWIDLMRNAVTLSACTPLFRGHNSTPVAWVLVARLGIIFAHASAILPKLLSWGAKHMWKGSSWRWRKTCYSWDQ